MAWRYVSPEGPRRNTHHGPFAHQKHCCTFPCHFLTSIYQIHACSGLARSTVYRSLSSFLVGSPWGHVVTNAHLPLSETCIFNYLSLWDPGNSETFHLPWHESLTVSRPTSSGKHGTIGGIREGALESFHQIKVLPYISEHGPLHISHQDKRYRLHQTTKICKGLTGKLGSCQCHHFSAPRYQIVQRWSELLEFFREDCLGVTAVCLCSLQQWRV